MAAANLGNAEWERSKVSNQDVNLLKRLGLMKKENAIRFPKEESYPNPPMEYRVSFVDHLIRGLSAPIHDFLRGLLFVYGIQLHQLTPNSILHVSIFITLCECFLGVAPNWALWKRLFRLRRNGSHNTTYNIGGVVICVRNDVDYFDVKFPDSVQGWRRRWLYIHEEDANSVEHNIVPFDGNAKIQRRYSWDAEASEEERKATEALMTRIHELQNLRGKELSGVQIIAYFLRIRVQPLQARKNPLWTYAGEKDANRLSKDLSVKDLEKLVRRITSLNKRDPIPSSCGVEPYSSTNPLPKNHPSMDSLPPLPEGGDVDERAIVSDDNQEAPSFVNEPAESRKSADCFKRLRAPISSSRQASPKAKRKRSVDEDSGTSQPEELLLYRKRQLMTHILRVSSARKFPVFCIFLFEEFLLALLSILPLVFNSDEDEETPNLDVAAERVVTTPKVFQSYELRMKNPRLPNKTLALTPPSSPEPLHRKGQGRKLSGAYSPIG
ncbi:hypothetical protein QYE76_051698 [Lolium multiflorum]|uniref:Transposase (putative) gypsy type domain-containing protein n=1 Tax=Lolium multiflorum TaxID=4521 RepID=A0AAD8STJ1_LOLMU|nr:hypothetical protein QYE76_051698 [Lolium multiflorum]